MAVELLTATMRVEPVYGTTTNHEATVEVASDASAGSLYIMAGGIPSGARIHGISALAWDALDTGSATMGLGVLRHDASGTTDTDALLSALDITSASTTAVSVISDHADWGKQVWELAGDPADPRSTYSIVVILDDDVDTGGSVSMSLVYSAA